MVTVIGSTKTSVLVTPPDHANSVREFVTVPVSVVDATPGIN